MVVSWEIGGGQTKSKAVAIGSSKLKLPAGMQLPMGTSSGLKPAPPLPSFETQHPATVAVAASAATTAAESTAPSPSAAPPAEASPPFSTECHGVAWVADEDATQIYLNGQPVERQWSMRDASGNLHGTGTDYNGTFTRLDYFLMALPATAISHFVKCTSARLFSRGKAPTDWNEALRFFGILILGTRFDFGDRRSLWKVHSNYGRFDRAANFGETGISCNRFDDLFTSARWSHQPDIRPPHMSTEVWRWLLVDDFVNHINQDRAVMFSLSSWICVDESISHWYGTGGEWINEGLPHYIAIDRKPENGCEIQNACDGESGIMMRLKIVKGPGVEEPFPPNKDLNHATKVLAYLVRP